MFRVRFRHQQHQMGQRWSGKPTGHHLLQNASPCRYRSIALTGPALAGDDQYQTASRRMGTLYETAEFWQGTRCRLPVQVNPSLRCKLSAPQPALDLLVHPKRKGFQILGHIRSNTLQRAAVPAPLTYSKFWNGLLNRSFRSRPVQFRTVIRFRRRPLSFRVKSGGSLCYPVP